MRSNAEKTTVMVADDHPIFLQGLVHVIEADPAFKLICHCIDGNEARENLDVYKPDVAVLDMSMPGRNGLELLRYIKQYKLPTKSIILTMHDDSYYFSAALEAGANGYVLKENSKKEILNCLHTVAAGGYFASAQFSNDWLKRDMGTLVKKQIASLTMAEKKILRLISENKTSRLIASELFISARTVENHRQHICDKLDLHGPHQLLHFALENKNKL